MRKRIIVGNFKMNMLTSEVAKYCCEVDMTAQKADFLNTIVAITPTYLSIETAKNHSMFIKVGAQNCHYEEKGAYTGEVSVEMLKEFNIDYCLVGHSERRTYYGETNDSCNKKIKKLLENGITPIYCVGETLNEYENNQTLDVIKEQVSVGLKDLTSEDVKKLVIAYEPVWSIGTGKNANKEIAQTTIHFIRETIKELFGSEASEEVLIQYGGSVKPENIKEYLDQEDIDGALVGGASLKSASFIEMIEKTF